MRPPKTARAPLAVQRITYLMLGNESKGPNRGRNVLVLKKNTVQHEPREFVLCTWSC